MELIATIIGFIGAAFIGFAATGAAKRPQAFTIIGAALVVVAFNVNGRF